MTPTARPATLTAHVDLYISRLVYFIPPTRLWILFAAMGLPTFVEKGNYISRENNWTFGTFGGCCLMTLVKIF